jgi:multidrug resistance efflux pump
MNKEVVTFYGFTENKETEINFNYSVAVSKIYVTPGQRVKAGAPLLDMYRIKTKETLADQPYRIETLRAKEKTWKSERQGDIQAIKSKERVKLAAIDADILKLKEQKAFQASLYKNLKSLEQKDKNFAILDSRIAALEREKTLVKASFEQEIKNVEQAIRVGGSPYLTEIKRLEAEQTFEAATKTIDVQVKAPSDGLIGNIYCKEVEHIPSYKTLISFYEPNPSLVKGFVHEDLILHVSLQDSFLIRSTKNPELFCFGVVTGLGSRIVEIPERLRKIPDLKTYGREILVSISKDNNFLQKEKVLLEFLNPPKDLKEPNRSRPMVDLKLQDKN